jgi:hypothetical protein
MMLKRSLYAAALIAFAAAVPGAAQTVLEKAVISAGGGTSASATMRVDATIAEAVTGVATNGQTVGQFGFWSTDGAITLSADGAAAGTITALRAAPNPTSEATRLSLSLARASSVEITLHDAVGRTIGTRRLGRLDAGEHVIPIDLAGLPSGSYSLVASVDGALLRVPVSVVR